MSSGTMTRSRVPRQPVRTRRPSRVRDVRGRAAAITRHVAARIRTVMRKEKREHIEPVREYLAEKPLRSLLIGGGIGLVLGFVLARR